MRKKEGEGANESALRDEAGYDGFGSKYTTVYTTYIIWKLLVVVFSFST